MGQEKKKMDCTLILLLPKQGQGNLEFSSDP